MRRWPRRRCARSAARSALAGRACGAWRYSTASAGSRSARRRCSSRCRPRTAATPSRRAAMRSTPSSAPFRCGRRSTSRTARSGWACRAADVDLVHAAERTIRRHAMLAGGETVLIGVSGGADSVALLHVLLRLAGALVLRLLEGTGVRGLAGIPPVRGRLIRPLLESRHRDAVAALRAAGIEWLEDPSNRDPRFFRNRVRHGLLPRLAEETGGDLVARLGRLAGRARAAVDAPDHVAAVELSRLAREEEGALVLSRSALAALPRPVAAEILRAAAASLGSRAPLRAWGHRGLRPVLADAPPRRPFRLGGVLVEVSGDRVRVGGTRAPAPAERELAEPGRVELPEIGRALEAVVVPATDYALPRERDRVAFDAAGLPPRLVVRARRRRDRSRPL